MDTLVALAIPGSIMALGAVVFLSAKLTSWRFDHKHPTLSRHGRRALAEDRERRSKLPVPLKPMSWDVLRAQPGSDLDATPIEGALGRLGKSVSAHRQRSEEDAA